MAKLSRLTLEYIDAYKYLQDLTPIAADCGELCGARCCHGDGETGMLLFPHEELLLSKAGYEITDAELRGIKVKFAVCGGECNRYLRPLSCRIYPFAPILQKDGSIRVICDPRAKPFCPLLIPEAEEYIRPEFIMAIQEVFTYLVKYPSMKKFLQAYTEMLLDYNKFMPTQA